MSAFGVRPQDRVAVFIDGPNLYVASKTAGFDIDFKNFTSVVGGEGRLLRSYYYTAIADTEEFNSVRPLVDWLGYNGFKVVTKPVREHFDQEGRKRIKSNMNVEIAVDALEISAHVDHIILFSGDGDLSPMVEAIQRKGVRVTVVSSKDGTSDELRRQADSFVDLRDLSSSLRRVQRSTERPAPVVERRPLTTR